MLFQSFSKVVILTEFKINQNYIARNLCVNRNKPELHCNGKCHLRKQLAKDDAEQNAPLSKIKFEKFEVALFFEKNQIKHFVFFESFDRPEFYIFDEGFVSSFNSEIFHPPNNTRPKYLLS